MEATTPRIRSLLRQARRVTESGKRAAAEKLYRQIIKEAPDSAEAWAGLADIVRDDDEKEAAYIQALQLDPDNDVARNGLAELRGEIVDEAANESAPETARRSTQDGAEASAFDEARNWLNEETARRRFDVLDGSRPSAEAAPPPPEETAVAMPDGHEHGAVDDESDVQLFCYRHPKRPTNLRCITCGKPICSSCAQHTPVGYRCPVCIREAQDVYFSATPFNYLLAALVALPLSLVAGFLVVNFGGGFFIILLMFFIGGAIGSLIGRVAFRAAGRRRGRYLPHVVAAMVVLGVLIPAAPILFALALGRLGALTGLIVPGIYLFVATSAAFFAAK